jgi:molybdenum cofactor guanylyltransferase
MPAGFAIRRDDLTGLILAADRDSRSGGADPGLRELDGEPLVKLALRRLAPQVGRVIVNANRNVGVYRWLGVPVYPDAEADFAGPLAGLMAGLARCETPWLATVAGDAPRLPLDCVARLAAAIGGAAVAVAATMQGHARRREPAFCLLRRELRDDLADYLRRGGRKVDRWLEMRGCVEVLFEDADAFASAAAQGAPDESARAGFVIHPVYSNARSRGLVEDP